MSLHVNNLQVVASGQHGKHVLLDSVNFQVGKHERIAVIGPSGSGKTTLFESLAQLRKWDAHFQYSGDVMLHDTNLFDLDPENWRKIRGKKITYIFQEPMACFNPLERMEQHLSKAWNAHAPSNIDFSKSPVKDWLEKVGLSNVEAILKSYPHQLSGGQLQRIMVVSALWHTPEIIMADEPYSSLDEKNRRQIQHLLDTEAEKSGASILLSTHDPEIIFNWATRVMVVKGGSIILDCPSEKLVQACENDDFISSVIHASGYRNQIKHRVFSLQSLGKQVLETANLTKSYKDLWRKNTVKTIFSSLNLQLSDHTSLGVTGPSGCGKSTLARILIKLEDADAGSIYWLGEDVSNLWGEALRKKRRDIQIVFQDTNLSLPPFLTIRELLLEVSTLYSANLDEIFQIFESLGLSEPLLDRLPSELSGGQRQRVCIVRALISKPKILILDEAISMLDPQHQFLVSEVLCSAQEKTGLALVFISHDSHWLGSFCREILRLED